MAAPQQSGRRRVTLGLIFLASATLITLDFQDFGPLGAIQTGAREVVAPIREGGERIASPITGLWRGATDLDELEEENEELRAEVDRLRGELVRSGVDRADYEALLTLNGLELPKGYPLLLARVKTGEVGNFTSGVVEIDVGSRDGVMKDMAVVTAAGLVGRIEQVDRTSSSVRLVSSNEFVIGVEVAGEVGLARGEGSTRELVIEQGIGTRAQISIGDPVTTTSSERSLFPPNLMVGTVARTSVTEDGSNRRVSVELAADPVDLRFVEVVLVEPGEVIEDVPEGIAR
jgi:rod shape-determining protein MreC